MSGHQTDDPCPPANVPRVGQDAVFPFWGRLSQIRMRKTCLAMLDEEIFHECWFGGRGNFRFQANYCDRQVCARRVPVEGAAGLSGVAGAQSHSEHVTQVLAVKDEARRAPLSPSLPKSEN